jgi:hypothetical protein
MVRVALLARFACRGSATEPPPAPTRAPPLGDARLIDAFVPADAYVAPSEDRVDIKPLVRAKPPAALPADASASCG